MTKEDNALSAQDLDKLFLAARAQPLEPSDDFMARLGADAARLQVRTQPQEQKRAFKPGLWDRISSWVPQMAWPVGLVTAGLTGVWIGSGSLPVVSDQTQSLFNSDLAYELAYRLPSLTTYLGGE